VVTPLVVLQVQLLLVVLVVTELPYQFLVHQSPMQVVVAELPITTQAEAIVADPVVVELV
jgi:hypothetical protein